MSLRTVQNDRLVDWAKLDLISVSTPINLDTIPTSAQLANKVDKTTTVNGHALSANVTVTATDVGLGNVTNVAQIPLSYLDTDGTLAANSDTRVASQKATKTYVDTGLATKEATLVSGTNIKTINGSSVLWSGDLSVSWGHIIEDEWTPLTQRNKLNFVWSWVTATDNGVDTTTVTIPWGTPLPTYTITNPTTDRAIDENATSINEIVNVLGTLITDVQTGLVWPVWPVWPNWVDTTDFYKYSIVTSVGSGNLTVALKNYAGNDPTSIAPVKVQIGTTVRTITAALSITKNAGTNWCNLWSAELATKETDLFAYLGYNATDWVTIGFSRIPTANLYSDFSVTSTNEKYAAISTITTASAWDSYNNIWRFNVILSAWAWYTWSIPATSLIVNYPIFRTQRLWYVSTLSWVGWAAPTGWTNLGYLYQIDWNKCFISGQGYSMTAWTTVTALQASIPFTAIWTANWIAQVNSHIWVADAINLTMGEINYQSGSLYIRCTSVSATMFLFEWWYWI